MGDGAAGGWHYVTAGDADVAVVVRGTDVDLLGGRIGDHARLASVGAAGDQH